MISWIEILECVLNVIVVMKDKDKKYYLFMYFGK